jgi:hypothetical protein
MGVPLAALSIRPPEQQPNALDQYAKFAQLRQMQQEAPLRQQALQQGVTAGAQDIAAKQDQLATQQATRAAYAKAVKPNAQGQPEIDTEALTQNLAQSGHGDAIPGILENVTKFQKSKADLQESQQKIQTYNQDTLGYAASAIQKAKYDPNVAHTLLDTLPSTPQIQALRQQIDSNPQQFKQIVDNAVSQSPAQQKAAEEEKVATIRAQGKPPEGELPLPNVDQMNQGLTTRYQVLNAGKPLPPQFTLPANATQKDYDRIDKLMQSTENATATKAQRDTASAAGSQLTKAALDQQAENYFNTGKLPPGGRGGAALAQNRAIMNRAAELHAGESLAAGSSEYKANSAALSGLQKNLDSVTAFENTALKNIDQVAQIAKTIPDLGVKFANVPLRKITGDMIGTDNMARLRTALASAQSESAKVLSSANASGVLSDHARDEAKDFLDGNLPLSAMLAQADQLKTDFGNRHQSYAEQIAAIKNRLGDKKAVSEGAGPAGGGAPQTEAAKWAAKYGGTVRTNQ